MFMTLNRTNKFTTSPRTFAASRPKILAPRSCSSPPPAATYAEPRLVQWIHVRADVRRMAALTSASGTDLDVNGFSFTHIRSTHVTDFLTCACGLKGHFTPAAKHRSCFRLGGFFHRMDLLLGTLRRHVSTLTTVPTRFGSIRTFAIYLALLTTLGLGLKSSRRSTHACQMTNLSTFSARFVRVRTVCWSVISVSAPQTCLLSPIVTFASSSRSLTTLA